MPPKVGHLVLLVPSPRPAATLRRLQGSNNAIQSVILCLGPLMYGARAYLSAAQKRDKYKNVMTELFQLHNVSNNSGVVDSLMDDAHEQDCIEAIVAYFMLFKMVRLRGGAGISKAELDLACENMLVWLMIRGKEVLPEDRPTVRWAARLGSTECCRVEPSAQPCSGSPSQIDFDVGDALEKLREFGIASRSTEGGQEVWKAGRISDCARATPILSAPVNDPWDGGTCGPIQVEDLVASLSKVSELTRLFDWSVPLDDTWSICHAKDGEGTRTDYLFNRRERRAVPIDEARSLGLDQKIKNIKCF